ncbi:zinc-binding dehydrogenase [Candidatus Gottesmanbacteria bacterium]|nr:zinc-binding dehydrogenase [Candidatus Gottesmanbacteria bacterium]
MTDIILRAFSNERLEGFIKEGLLKAAILMGIKDMRVQEVDTPVPGKGEIVLKVRACAVCGSDIRIFYHGNDRVTYPAIIGHEISGEVFELGEGVEGFEAGDRLAVGADVPNMRDDWGKAGMANLCDINYAMGYQLQGGFAEYCLLNELVVNYGPVTKIPEHVSFEEASLCEPLACCINGLELAFMQPGKSILIIGAGPIGILLYRTAIAFGAGTVVLTDIEEARLNLARSLEIENVFNSKELSLPDIAAHFRDCKGGFNIVITACSSPEAQEEAVGVVSKRGVVNYFGGLPENARKISISSNTLHYSEAFITGSHGSTPRQHRLAMKIIADERIDVKSLVSHVFRLDDIIDAFNVVEQRKGLKVIIKPHQN